MSALSMRPRRDWLIPMVSLTLVFLAAARAPIDSDLWWHLAAGRWTWANGQPLLMDVFSFTRSGVSWINHSWLSQWLLFAIYSLGGQLALGGLVASLATLCMGLVYAQMRGPAIYRAFLVVLACMVTAVVWTARPQMFSLALFGFLSWILFLFKWRKRNYLWTLPPLFWLWSNLHGGWSLGLMLLGCFGAGELLNHVLRSPAPEVVAWSDLKKLAAWGALAIFVLPINPNGISILKIPFDTVGVQALQQTIQEWASPDFHDLTQQPMLWLLIGLTLVFGLGGRKVDGGDLLTVAWFGALALLARRNYGPFGLAVVPILSRYLWAWISSWKQSEVHIGTQWGPGNEEMHPARRRPRWQQVVNLLLVGLLGMAAIVKLWVVTSPYVILPAVRANYPVQAVEYLKQVAGQGRILNEYAWGGYLDWELPGAPVFVDGRTDLFGDAVIGEWMKLMQAQGDWGKAVERWKIDWILIEPDRPLATALKNQTSWKLVQQDDHSTLWQKVQEGVR